MLTGRKSWLNTALDRPRDYLPATRYNFNMCGRFSIYSNTKDIVHYFHLVRTCEPILSYNISPSSTVPVVILEDNNRIMENMHWGLVPHWARDKKLKPINARAETIDTRPFFRTAFKKTRCLIPANGFYEWRRAGNHKQPYYFRLENNDLMAFAGLWDRWKHNDETIESCTIITTRANDIMKPVHDRMPVILAPDSYEQWLQDGGKDLLQPYPGPMITYPVSTVVNNPKNNGRDLIQELQEEN